MKTLFLTLFTLALALLPTELYADDVTTMVQGEMNKTQSEVMKECKQANQKLAELRGQREKILIDSKKQGEDEMKGKELMAKYVTLLMARYRNDKNEFEVGMPVSSDDQERINKLFQKYLTSQPLVGLTSAGEAKRTLEMGQRNLAEMAKMHMNPLEKNNSQLEILEYQVQTTEANLKKTMELAKALGVTLASDRAPASK